VDQPAQGNHRTVSRLTPVGTVQLEKFRHGDAALDRKYVSADFSYTADYWLVDKENAGPGDDDYDPSFDTLEDLQEWLHDIPIEWYSPNVSLALIGRLSGYDGKRVP
jgi:hypothetical protein